MNEIVHVRYQFGSRAYVRVYFGHKGGILENIIERFLNISFLFNV